MLCASCLVNPISLTRSIWLWIAKVTSSEVISVTLRCLENTVLVTESPLIYPTHQTRTSDHSKVASSHALILTSPVILPLPNLFMPSSSEFLKVTHTYDMHTGKPHMPQNKRKYLSTKSERKCRNPKLKHRFSLKSLKLSKRGNKRSRLDHWLVMTVS